MTNPRRRLIEREVEALAGVRQVAQVVGAEPRVLLAEVTLTDDDIDVLKGFLLADEDVADLLEISMSEDEVSTAMKELAVRRSAALAALSAQLSGMKEERGA